MRKKYLLKNSSNIDFWDDNWSKTSLNGAIKYCNIDVLKQFFNKYFPKKGRILEGGCGLGQHVIYYSRLGYEIEGVDFGEGTIRATKRLYHNAFLKVGDVRQLNYPDSYFKAYYSGGVVEHFEEGADQVLKEIL